MSNVDRDNYIRDLWQDSSFPGSFTGIATFQKNLESEKKIKISQRHLKNILSFLPSYLQNITYNKKFLRREYFVHGWNKLWQMDLAEMKPTNGYRYIFVLVEVYTLFTVTKCLINKRSNTIEKVLKSVIDKYGKPESIETDAGGEFLGLKSYLKEMGINFNIKKPPIKCAYAESMIYHLKRKIYIEMRLKHTTHWEELVEAITMSMNKAKHQSIGNLSPIDLTSKEKAVQIDIATNYKNIPQYHEIFFKEKKELDKSSLKVGDFVYVAVPMQTKGFEVKVILPNLVKN